MTQNSIVRGTFPGDPTAGGLPGVRLVLRRWWWVAAGALLGLLVGLGAGLFLHPQYESTAILTVSTAAPVNADNVSRAAQALARLATQPGVVGAPLRRAGLPEAADAPRLSVRVQAAPDAPIISVTGTGSTPAIAREVTRTVSRALVGLQPYPPFSATVVAEPTLPTAPTRPRWALPAGGLGTGAGLAIVLAATLPGRRGRELDGVAPGRPAT